MRKDKAPDRTERLKDTYIFLLPHQISLFRDQIKDFYQEINFTEGIECQKKNRGKKQMRYVLIILTLLLIGGCSSKQAEFRDKNLEWDVWVDIVECFYGEGFDQPGILPTIELNARPCNAPVIVEVEDGVFEVLARTCNPTLIHIRPKFYYKDDFVNITLLRHEYKHAYLWQTTGHFGDHDGKWFNDETPCPDKED